MKLLEENIGNMFFDIGLSNIFFKYISSGNRNKCKNKQMGLHQTKKLLCSKGNYQQNEKGCLLDGRRYLQIIYRIRG